MKRVLVFQHVAHEILGTLHPLLKDAGFRIRYANFGRDPGTEVAMDRYDGLVVLGGPMGAYEGDKYPHLEVEKEAIRRAIKDEKPVLGICLGAQLIASALGAKVGPSPVKEIGWYEVSLTDEGKSDPLLKDLQPTEWIFQWHGDALELPPGAVWLASSESCAAQAFRVGEKVYGFQFHLEVDEAMIERWLHVHSNQADLMSLGGPAHTERIRAATGKHIRHQTQLGKRVFSRYIELFSTKRRRILLDSGHK